MNWFINFCIGSINSFVLYETIISFNVFRYFKVDDILSALVALVGGIISTILINILRAKYPGLFNQKGAK